MTVNSLLASLEKIFVWTFESILEPIGDGFNWVCIVGGFIGLFIWLKMQGSYNKEAERTGGIK